MKTKVFCNFIMIMVLAIVFANLKPPQPMVVAQSSPVKAVQQPKTAETVIIPSETKIAQETSETKPSDLKQAPTFLTERQQLMQDAGIPDNQWNAAESIINNESGWCATKWEGEYGYCPEFHGVPDDGGYGLCQSTPASKMASAGSDWATSVLTQLKWCNQYAQGYGDWNQAKTFRNCTGTCYSPRSHTTLNKTTTWF